MGVLLAAYRPAPVGAHLQIMIPNWIQQFCRTRPLVEDLLLRGAHVCAAMAESSCTVTCQLRRSTYVAGELVTGLINLSIPHSTELCTVEVLEVS
jgi:hypothetical protein